MKTRASNISAFSQMKIVIVAILLGILSSIHGQDPTFSQFYNNPVFYNPAYTGSNPGMRARLNYRNQWHNLPTNYNNYTFSLDAAEPNLPGAGGIGLIVSSDFDGFGNVKTTSAALTTSVKIELSEEFITMFGIGASFAQKSIDWNGLVFSDQLDPRYGKQYETSFVKPDFYKVYYPDFSAGMLFRYCESSEYFNRIIATFAFSAQHVFQPDISFTGIGTKLPLKLVITSDLLLDNEDSSPAVRGRSRNKASDYKINPGFLFEKQGDMTNFSLGVNGYKNNIYTGIWFRSQSFTLTNVNDLIIMLGVNIPFGENSTIRLMYSYDYVLTDLRRSVGATHEISLLYGLSNFSFFGNQSMPSAGRGLSNQRNSQSCANCPLF